MCCLLCQANENASLKSAVQHVLAKCLHLRWKFLLTWYVCETAFIHCIYTRDLSLERAVFELDA